MIIYVDTSAALKLLIDETGTDAMVDQFDTWQKRGEDLISSYLLLTELHCAARRRGIAHPRVIDTLLAAIELIDLDREHLLSAARTPHGLRSADAIHLAVASSLEAEAFVAYDRELCSAAEREGMRVLRPGL